MNQEDIMDNDGKNDGESHEGNKRNRNSDCHFHV